VRDQARAILARDVAQATAARHDAERYATLASKGYVTRSQAEQLHATALAQEATVVADRAALRTAERNLGFAIIRAPIAGRTGSVRLRRGDLVGPQTGPLVVINQLRPILVRFPVLAGDFGLLRAAVAAHPLPVTATSSDSAEFKEIGALNFLDNAIDSLTGTVTGKATFPNPGRRLWPGELVFLTIALDVQRGVLAVPNEAVLAGQQGPFVYVVDAKNTAQTRSVVTGLTVGELTVVAQGLADGERVVIDGQSRLNPGSHVSLIGPGADTAGRSLSSTGDGSGGSAAGEVTGVATGGNPSPNGNGRGGGANAAGTLTNGNVGVGGRAGGVAPAPSMSGVTGTPGTASPSNGASGRTNGVTTTPPTTTSPNGTGTKAPTTTTRPPAPSASGTSRP